MKVWVAPNATRRSMSSSDIVSCLSSISWFLLLKALVMTTITFRIGTDLDLDELIELYSATSLGVRRPLDDRDTMADMLRHANLIVTAWEGPLLVGVSRSLTDFSYVAYLSDLAVRESHQHQGIGRNLIHHARGSWPALQARPALRPAGHRLLPETRFHATSLRVDAGRSRATVGVRRSVRVVPP